MTSPKWWNEPAVEGHRAGCLCKPCVKVVSRRRAKHEREEARKKRRLELLKAQNQNVKRGRTKWEKIRETDNTAALLWPEHY
jgi:hypothetical protein